MNEPKPRGLWDVMGHQSDAAAEVSPNDSSASSSGKGLWAMMGVKSPPVPSTQETHSDEESVPTPPPGWFRAKSDAPVKHTPEAELSPIIEEEPYGEVPIPRTIVEEKPQPLPPLKPLVMAEHESRGQEKLAQITAKVGRSRGAVISALVGLFAIPMAFLAARPEIWTRIPATVLGFGALVIGLISFNEVQRSRGQQRGTGLAMLGMILGTISMFLGPLVIAPWSANQSRSQTRQETKLHLETIGTALKGYHQQYQRFPPGGTYRVEPNGDSTPMHSWMTHLLPYLDQQATFAEIQLESPWSEPMNKPPLGRKIPAFLAAGVEPVHNQAGYGLSHFAAVAGQVQVMDGRYANLGIFERSSNVSRDDVTDGLSQTLVAGEIPEGFRPWGEPGNWRAIGERLCQGSEGFGNTGGTGALFLRADGSVQFYSKSVSADVLKRLGTRDGDDNRMIPERLR